MEGGTLLHEFLSENKIGILAISEEKTRHLAGMRGASEQLKLGLPLFYEQLILVLEEKLNNDAPKEMLVAAANHGREFLNLGYSLSHVVHAYGAMCQAITELATLKNAKISAEEFNILNGCLDVAIASAVSEFHFQSNLVAEEREIKSLGFLAHELRNALSSATIAQEMIKAGLVGTGGSTANVLEANLARMRHLIDRSLSEVRMRSDADVFIEKFRLIDLFEHILTTARMDSNKKNQTLQAVVDWQIEIEADRQFILSAVSNLMQNAIKYTSAGKIIVLRAHLKGERVLISVEDECGGIDATKINALFDPYVHSGVDKSGLGLGLAITQRAVQLSQGTMSVHNMPGIGCVFTIDIPQCLIPGPSAKATVQGKDSVQPGFRKRS